MRYLFSLLVGFVIFQNSVFAQVTFSTVVVTGQPAPGSGGLTFNTGGFTYLNAAGEVQLSPNLAGPGVSSSNSASIWSGPPNSPQLVMREGDPAADLPGLTYSSTGSPDDTGFSQDGQATFVNYLNGPGMTSTNDNAFFIGSPTGTHLIAQAGTAAPDTGGADYVLFSDFQPTLTTGGRVTFTDYLQGTGVTSANNVGIWDGTAGNIHLLVRSGDPAPGAESGTVFGHANMNPAFDNPYIDAQGDILFSGLLSGPTVDTTNDAGLWLYSASGTATLVARSGQQAPGTAAGVVWQGGSLPFVKANLNSSGEVAFQSYVSGPGVNSTNSGGIWMGMPGNLQLAVRAGAPAPGAVGGAEFMPEIPPDLNDRGQIAFVTELTNSTKANNEGIWMGTPGALHMIAEVTDQAPGTATGVKFSYFTAPFINNEGQVAFLGQLTGTGVTSSNNVALFATDPNGNLELIVRDGSLFTVAPGDQRTIQSISTTDGESFGRLDPLNDNGQLGFELQFTDGSSGSFLAQVPEPNMLGFLIVNSVALLGNSRRLVRLRQFKF